MDYRKELARQGSARHQVEPQPITNGIGADQPAITGVIDVMAGRRIQ